MILLSGILRGLGGSEITISTYLGRYIILLVLDLDIGGL
jgi:hypothetical protein